MRDILADVDRWQKEGVPVALATVIQTWGTSPRLAGAKMALTSDGRIAGSVSGGCVENIVVEAGVESLRTGRTLLLRFGVSDETAWEAGLSCGGSIDVFVKPLDAKFFAVLRSVMENEERAVVATVVRGPDDVAGREILIREDNSIAGTLSDELDKVALKLTNQVLQNGVSQRVLLHEEIEIFLEVIIPPPTLVIVGGVHIAVALVSLAKTLGFRTILIDPRKAWGNAERFPNVDKLIQTWVDEAFEQIKINASTAVAVLTHDPKIDDPAIKIALNSSAFYVGALGSKTTNAKRRERLLNDGVSESQINKIHAPIGLDIGAQNPEEIALAIMSEVVKSFRKQNQVEVKHEAQSPISNSLFSEVL